MIKKGMNKPKVIWVDSWQDIPCKNPDATLQGWSDPKTGKIYAIRGVTSKADVEHEKYHAFKKHPEWPRDYKAFVLQEIEATKYAYDKIGQPAHIKEKLRAIFNDTMRKYNVRPTQVITAIENALDDVIAPDSWKQDFKQVVKEVHKVYGKGRE